MLGRGTLRCISFAWTTIFPLRKLGVFSGGAITRRSCMPSKKSATSFPIPNPCASIFLLFVKKYMVSYLGSFQARTWLVLERYLPGRFRFFHQLSPFFHNLFHNNSAFFAHEGMKKPTEGGLGVLYFSSIP